MCCLWFWISFSPIILWRKCLWRKDKEMMDLRHAETRNMISASSFWYSTTCPHWRIRRHEIPGSKVWLKRALRIEQQRSNLSQIVKCKQSMIHSHLTHQNYISTTRQCYTFFWENAIESFIHPQPSNAPSLWIRLATDSMPAEMASNGKKGNISHSTLFYDLLCLSIIEYYRILS